MLGIRLQTSPELIRLVSWSLGDGLATHIAEHGTPPVCDVIVYPDDSGMFSVMALSVPYSSEQYGREWLRVRYEVTAPGPRSSCLFLQSDTEDYEPGAISRLNRLISGAERRCVPILIRDEPRFPRGDVDGNGATNLSDAIALLGHLFVSDRGLTCADAADVDDTEDELPDCEHYEC